MSAEFLITGLDDLGSLASQGIRDLAKEAVSKLLRSATQKHTDTKKLSTSLENRLREALSWSSRVQFFGMASGLPTAASTVGLVAGEPRRFRNPSAPGTTVRETALVQRKSHLILLGAPGSGKTTTLKRIVVRLFSERGQKNLAPYRYPFVIRLREFRESDSLLRYLASALALEVTSEPIRRDKEGNPLEWRDFVGPTPLLDAIGSCLNNAQILLLIDGMDELRSNLRDEFYTELVSLSYQLSDSKIIATTRSGDFNRHIENFDLLELIPLSPDQQETVARKWLPDADRFLDALRSLPYADAADRPLLLAQLIVLFQLEGTLPLQPSRVYKRLITLLLDEWNRKQDVRRISRYAGFDAERKLDFLSALSFELTYRIKQRRFSHQDFVAAYQSIHQTFSLPMKEAEAVAAEIETHNGLIQAAGVGGFEFSHLSLQEYLCAEYLVRTPFPRTAEKYIREYTAPLAVAVALAGDPGDWVAGLLLSSANAGAWDPEAVTSFLERVLIERPGFRLNPLLGIAIADLWLRYRNYPAITRSLNGLSEIDLVSESLWSAFRNYFLVQPPIPEASGDPFVRLRQIGKHYNLYGLETPRVIGVPSEILRALVQKFGPLMIGGDAPTGKVYLNANGNLQYIQHYG